MLLDVSARSAFSGRAIKFTQSYQSAHGLHRLDELDWNMHTCGRGLCATWRDPNFVVNGNQMTSMSRVEIQPSEPIIRAHNLFAD